VDKIKEIMLKLSQKESIRRWLIKGRPITAPQAQAHYNIWRLASLIARLRNEGMQIDNIGKPGKQAKYKLIKDN